MQTFNLQDWIFPGITLLILVLLSCFVWIRISKNHQSLILPAILLLGLALRVFTSSDPYLHSWDERYHALVAKNMVSHPFEPTLHENEVLEHDNSNWVGSHLWVGKPPFPLWIMSGSIALFGNNLLAVRLPSVLLGLLSIYLTFLIGKRLFNERVGLIAAFFHSINGLALELVGGRVSSDHVELCFTVMVELAIYLIIINLREKASIRLTFIAGLVSGIAFLSKWYPGLIVFPVWFVLFGIHNQFNFRILIKHGVILILGFFTLTAPWIGYMYELHPNEINAILFNALSAYSETVESHDAPFYYYLKKVMIIFGELFYLFLIYFIWKVRKEERAASVYGILTWILIPLLIFSFADTKRFTYLMISAPALFIVAATFISALLKGYGQAKYKWLNVILVVFSILLPLRYTIERAKIFGGNELIPECYGFLDQAKEKFDDKTVVFGTDDYVELMFHTDVYAAYRKIPNSKKIKELRHEGFEVYIIENGKILLQD